MWEKKKKHFSPSPTVFSTLSKREIIILATFNLSSASALNFAMSKILSFGKELLSLTLNQGHPCKNISQTLVKGHSVTLHDT